MIERFPKLYAIVDRATLEARGVTVGEFVRELREAGVRLVQYRDKVGSPQEILRACAEIREVFAGVGATLILNDRADLAVLAGWDGVHVGQGDLPVEAVRRVVGDYAGAGESRFLGSLGMTERKGSANAGVLPLHVAQGQDDMRKRWVVGVSTHNKQQVLPLRDAQGQDDKFSWVDYVAVGPVFGTASKADAEPVIGLEGVRRMRALTAKPMIAIGGITLTNAASVVEAGADAVAVIGGMFVEGRRVGEVARDFLRILG
ncbi:MAG TPA: thiamine phosphate synthase [Acidobacteriaceae bacterium]|jgi:thiamine-phosphate pyrophosphorylase|nr:thiamine phosphate synthase [Acidobacteriaceae bacterium]